MEYAKKNSIWGFLIFLKFPSLDILSLWAREQVHISRRFTQILGQLKIFLVKNSNE